MRGPAGRAGFRTWRSSRTTSVAGTVKFWGIGSAAEQKNFQKVIAGFEKQSPNVTVSYTSKGNDIPTILATAIAGGSPPDMADVAQPGLVTQLVHQGKLKPITYATSTIDKNFAPAWKKLGTYSGKLYALVFKAANKSTLWYNVPAFKAAGVKAVFSEAPFNPKLAQTLADEAGIRTVVTTLYNDALGPAPADSYPGMMRWNVSQIVEALR